MKHSRIILRKGYLTFLLIISGFLVLNAQENKGLSLDIISSIEKEKKFVNSIKYRRAFKTDKERNDELLKVLYFLYGKGYLTARYDSISSDSLSMKAYVFVGDHYQLTYLGQGNLDEPALRQAGYRGRRYQKPTSFDQDELTQMINSILEYYENNGYPFASIKLDSVSIRKQEVSAALYLEKNNKIIIDSIIIEGDARVHMNYIYQYLEIKPGEPYDESRISQIDNKLKELAFVNATKPHEVIFSPEEASIVLFIDKQRASNFDGIIGVAPNSETTGKLLITGDVKLKLLNTFKRGELIDFNWRKMEESSQDLKFNFIFPYLFKTPFGFDYRFHLFKKDTSFLTLNNHLGIQYLFSSNSYIKAYYENQNSSLISTSGLEFITTLPDYADVKTSLYGLEGTYEKLDYRYNPKTGFTFNGSGAVGRKEIRKNDNVNQALYDSLQLKSTIYRINVNAGVFIPVYNNLIFFANTQNGYLNNPNLFENELFRIGGLKTLRGFDEESIYASLYSILNVEFRYLFDINSFFSIFWNGAYYEKSTHSTFISDTPFGFGAGLTFGTRAGIFTVSYALGKQFDLPVELRSAKIHFGFLASF
jgi:outer membrane protein assembly factor BamA